MAEHQGDAYTVERARLLSAFGENLRAMRERRNLAQERLAEVANVHRNEIGILERGQCEPGLLTLLILADTLEVEPRVLLAGLFVPRERRPARCFKGARGRGRSAALDGPAPRSRRGREAPRAGERAGREVLEMTTKGSR
jgi:transcriptional regulator with XRE-family HTH domain